MSNKKEDFNQIVEPELTNSEKKQVLDQTLDKSSSTSLIKEQTTNSTDLDQDLENQNKQVYETAWPKKLLYIAYAGLIFTALVENFAADSTKNLDSYATSSFNAHSLIATAAVVYKISAICAYPILAKLADLLGRGEGFGLAIFLYTVAYILYAACGNVETYIIAEIFYAIGRNGYRVFQQIFIADTTSLINRGIWSQLPGALTAVPSLYAGSEVMDAFLEHSTWRWGYGCFAIIIGVSMIPLTLIMTILDKRAKKLGQRKEIQVLKNLPQGSIWKKTYHLLFVELDVLGGVLLIVGFALFFIPFTLTGKQSSYRWHEGKLIAMLVIGFITFWCFVAWNALYKHKPIPNRKPFVPPQSLTNKTVIIVLVMVALDLCENSSFATYFSTVLQVGGYYTAGEATRIDNSKKATIDIASVICGLLMKYTKRSKIYVMIGVPFLVLGHGLLVYFMNRDGKLEKTVLLIVMEVFIGLGRGFYQCGLQVTIQAIAGVDGIAMSTAFFMAFNSVGSLIGSAIAGGIWNSVLLNKLEKYLPTDSKSKATSIYKSIKVAKSFKKGTPERIAISKAYRETIQIIGYTGLGIIAPMLILMFLIKEVKLTDKRDIYEGDNVEDEAEGVQVPVNNTTIPATEPMVIKK